MIKLSTVRYAAALAIGAAALTFAAPAFAATPAPAPAAKAVHILRAGSILCSGDLCLQTLSVSGVPSCTAVVRTWPFNVNLYGHFEMSEPFNNHYTQNSQGGDRSWRAGIDGFDFTIPYFHTNDTYYGIAWQRNNPGKLPANYSKVGVVGFGIAGPDGC